MSDPTSRALAAYHRLVPEPSPAPSTGCHVDLSGVPEQDRPGLVLAIRGLVGLSRPVSIPSEPGAEDPAGTLTARRGQSGVTGGAGC